MRLRDVELLEYDQSRATPGFTLFSPLQAEDAYLLGMRGEVLHQWKLPGKKGGYAYLIPNGNTIFNGFERFTEESKSRLRGGIPGSEMEDDGVLGDTIFEVAPNGDIVWEWHAQDDMEIENYPLHGLCQSKSA